MTHKKKMLRLNRYIQFKLIESYENGKNPLYVKDVAKKRRASVYQVKLAGKRACKKVPFPTIRLFDLTINSFWFKLSTMITFCFKLDIKYN